jgi:transketolase
MNDREKLKELRLRILRAAHATKEGHVASAFSVLDIIYALYRYWLWYTPLEPKTPARDYFILSKGHGAMALYAVLAEMKFFSPDLLNTYYQKDSILGGHPDRLRVPGVEVSTGSLGHGLPMAVGLAMALRKEGLNNKVVCVVGDGEINEGSCWESLLLAGHHGLGNLTIIVDYNRSTDAALNLYPLAGKVIGFHFDIREIDGHDLSDIGMVMSTAGQSHEVVPGLKAQNVLPRFIVADTIKGKGVKAIEDNPQAWHHRYPTAEELAEFEKELAPNPLFT